MSIGKDIVGWLFGAISAALGLISVVTTLWWLSVSGIVCGIIGTALNLRGARTGAVLSMAGIIFGTVCLAAVIATVIA